MKTVFYNFAVMPDCWIFFSPAYVLFIATTNSIVMNNLRQPNSITTSVFWGCINNCQNHFPVMMNSKALFNTGIVSALWLFLVCTFTVRNWTHTHTLASMYTHKYASKHVHTHTHNACIHTCTCTHTHTHTHTVWKHLLWSQSISNWSS